MIEGRGGLITVFLAGIGVGAGALVLLSGSPQPAPLGPRLDALELQALGAKLAQVTTDRDRWQRDATAKGLRLEELRAAGFELRSTLNTSTGEIMLDCTSSSSAPPGTANTHDSNAPGGAPLQIGIDVETNEARYKDDLGREVLEGITNVYQTQPGPRRLVKSHRWKPGLVQFVTAPLEAPPVAVLRGWGLGGALFGDREGVGLGLAVAPPQKILRRGKYQLELEPHLGFTLWGQRAVFATYVARF